MVSLLAFFNVAVIVFKAVKAVVTSSLTPKTISQKVDFLHSLDWCHLQERLTSRQSMAGTNLTNIASVVGFLCRKRHYSLLHWGLSFRFGLTVS